uniref:transposase n=1 Tax=Mariniflexile sp. TaxID=1979402 RepID=UPI00404768A4
MTLEEFYEELNDVDASHGTRVKYAKIVLNDMDLFPKLIEILFRVDDKVSTRAACSDLSLSYDKVTAIYKKRWAVEEYHKSIKSNTGFSTSPTKKTETQMNHFALSIVAYIKLEWLKQRTGKNHFAMKAQIYLAAQQAAYLELKKLSTSKAA